MGAAETGGPTRKVCDGTVAIFTLPVRNEAPNKTVKGHGQFLFGCQAVEDRRIEGKKAPIGAFVAETAKLNDN